MTSIESSLDRLGALAGQLNAETDTLNWVIEAVENRLESMNLGVTYWDGFLLDAEEEPGHKGDVRVTYGWVLGYYKIADRWRLAIKGVRVEEGFFENDLNCPYRNVDDDKEPVALLRASRAVRVQAMERLQVLVDGLAEKVSQYVANIGSAKKLVSD